MRLAATTLVLASGWFCLTAVAQAADGSVAVGAVGFGARCAACHGTALEGGQHAPPLVGQRFDSDWNGKPARLLYSRIISTMPQDDPGSLSPEQALSITLFVFDKNGVTLGSRPVATANDLNGLVIAVRPSAP